MSEKQLSLFNDLEVVPSFNSLSRDEQHFMFYLIAKDGGMIPPDYFETKEAVKSLKSKGMVRDSLIAAGYVEITPFGERLASEFFQWQIQTGQIRICSR